MKKLLFFAAMMLGLASCQTEPEGLGVDMGAQETNITVALPETTRATDSAEGAFENVDLSGNATIRYILKIYQKVGNEYVASEDRQVKYSDEKSVVFPVRLVPNRDYRFVVWADYVTGEADVDYHYNTTDLTNITLNNTWVAMDETRDAFTGVYCTVMEGKQYTSASSINIALTRPFAKLRIITTDMEQLNDLGIAPTTATVEYKVAHYNAFNAFAGEAIGDSKNRNIKHENFAIKAYDDNVDGESMVLFTDYFFANTDVVKFELTVVDQNGAVIDDTIAFNTDINVKRNHLTTITGDILTDGNNIKVEVDDEFANEYIYLEGDVTLTENLVIDRPMVVRAGAKAVLNLNGHNIINNTKSETFGEGEGIIAYGELDIIGDGTVQGSTMAVWARGNAGAVVNIYGGTFLGCEEGFAKGGRSVVYASSGNVVNIYGGNVQALAADKTSYADKIDGVYAALNIADRNGMINVYGGSFYKQNPAVPGTEPSDWNATHPNGFLAEDCVVETHGDWFKVIYDPYYGYTKVSTIDGLNDAINNATTDINIVFLNDIVGDVNMNEKKTVNVTINGDGKTYTGAMILKHTGITIKNVNFDGKGFDGYAITTRGTDYLTIEDCTAKNYGYGFVQLASGTVLTTVKDVTVSNVNYGVKVDYSNAVVLENANITAGVAAVLNSNYGEKPITIKNSKLNILGTWTRNNTFKTNYVFEGDNTINTFIIDAAIDNFKLAAGATLTAPNEITVTTDAGYTVGYADGKYISK